jgi:hypothetical protein
MELFFAIGAADFSQSPHDFSIDFVNEFGADSLSEVN